MTTVEWDDVSHWQGAFNPSRFTVAKATEGTGTKDPEYAGIKSRADAKHLEFAGYHFLTSADVVAQAKFAFSVIGKTPAMVDAELEGSSFPTFNQALGFVREYRALGGIMHVSYIPRWFWSGHWGSVNMQALADLAVKNINSDYSNDSDAVAMAEFGNLPNLGRQYTSTPHDLNRANLTPAQLWTAFTGVPAPQVAHPVGSRTVVQGMTGADVHWIQVKIGAAHMGAADSKAGPLFTSGVEWWQRQHKLSVDGKVGPLTYKSMGVTMK